MTAPAHVVADSATMLHRNLLHAVRYPGLTVYTVGFPVVILLMVVYVFGGTLGDGLPGTAAGGTAAYLTYVVPGMVVLTISGMSQGTAISVAMDMCEGIVARFRSMAISRAAVLTGHVLGSVIQGLVAVALVLGVALLMGYRPRASLLDWLGLVGMVLLVTTALVWLTVAMGMAAKSVETASNLPLPLVLLPVLGSGFVPTGSMPAGLRWFAEHQPFTPIMETLRGLLDGAAPQASTVVTAVLWSLALALAGYAWSRRLYERRSVR